MSILLLVLMALLLGAALERNNRRQPPSPPGLTGTHDRDDRDWARTQLDLLALGDQAGGGAAAATVFVPADLGGGVEVDERGSKPRGYASPGRGRPPSRHRSYTPKRPGPPP
jgi:hypothetical protein